MTLRAMLCGLSVLVATLWAPGASAEDELRQCPDEGCARFALSDSWRYCPYCGTRLPELEIGVATRTLEEVVLGNMYRNGRYGFQIERPNRRWKILTRGKGLEEMNEDATVGFQSEDDIYSMVIVERMPGVSLDAYARLVEPDIEDRIQIYRKEAKINGVDAVRLKWRGEVNNVPFSFFSTLLRQDDLAFHIVSWCVAGNDTKAVRVQIEAIEESFRTLPGAKGDAPGTQEEEQ